MKELKIDSPVKIDNIEKLKSEAYDKIMADKLVRAFLKEHDLDSSFVAENLGLFLRMVEENAPCAKCHSFKDCKKHNLQKGYLTYVDKDETIYYEKCKYYREYLAYADLYTFKDFDDDLMFTDLSDKDIVDPASNSLYKIILKGIINHENLYISTKDNMDIVTELLVSAINHIIKKNTNNTSVAYLTSTTLRDNIDKYNRYDQDKLYDYKEKVFNADILVIASLGSEENSEYFKYSFLMDLISYRGSHNLTTFISSYYNMDQLKEVYTGYNLMNKTKLLIDKLNEYFKSNEFNTILRRDK